MNAPKFILLAGLFAIITAEFSFAQNTPTPTATVEPDPITSFKELVARFPKRCLGKGSKTYNVDIQDVDFDVKKTESLLTPVIGILDFSAKTEFGLRLTVVMQSRLIFTWQGDHWEFERLQDRKNGSFTREASEALKWCDGALSDFLKSCNE